jgi:DNA-binding response OmpR family regulator
MNKPKEYKIFHRVHVINWPEESQRLKECRSLNIPFILAVAPDIQIPRLVAGREDWVRRPARRAELEERAAPLLDYAQGYPTLDTDGVLRFQENIVPLSPAAAALMSALTRVPHRLVGREEMLKNLGKVHQEPTENSLNIHVLRLRRKLVPLGLHIETIRNRGYMLRILNASTEPDQ